MNTYEGWSGPRQCLRAAELPERIRGHSALVTALLVLTILATFTAAPRAASAADPAQPPGKGDGRTAKTEKSCAFTASPSQAIWNGEVALDATTGGFGQDRGEVRLHDSKKVHDVKTRQGTPLAVTGWDDNRIAAMLPAVPPGPPGITYVIAVTRADQRDPCAFLDMFEPDNNSKTASPNSNNNTTTTNEILEQNAIACAFNVTPVENQYWDSPITLTRRSDIPANGYFTNRDGVVPGEVRIFNVLSAAVTTVIPGTQWSTNGTTITATIPASLRTPGVTYGISVTRAPAQLEPVPLPCGTHIMDLDLPPLPSDNCPFRTPALAYWGDTVQAVYDLSSLPAGTVARNFGPSTGTVLLRNDLDGQTRDVTVTWREASIDVALGVSPGYGSLFTLSVTRAQEPSPCGSTKIAIGQPGLVPQCPFVPGLPIWGQRVTLPYAAAALPNNPVLADFGGPPGGVVRLSYTDGQGMDQTLDLTRVWGARSIEVDLPAVEPEHAGVFWISVIRAGESQPCHRTVLPAVYIDCSIIGPALTEAFSHMTLTRSGQVQQIPLALGSTRRDLSTGPLEKIDLSVPETPQTTNQLTQLLTRDIGASIDFGVVASKVDPISDTELATDTREFHADSGSLTFGGGGITPAWSISGLLVQPKVIPVPAQAPIAAQGWKLAVKANVYVPGCDSFEPLLAELFFDQTPLVLPSVDIFFSEPDMKGDALVLLKSRGLPLEELFEWNGLALPAGMPTAGVPGGAAFSSRTNSDGAVRDAVANVLEHGVGTALGALSVFDLGGPNQLFPGQDHVAKMVAAAAQLRYAPKWAVDARGGQLDLASDEHGKDFMQWNGNPTLSSVFMVGVPTAGGIRASGDHKCVWAQCFWVEPEVVETLKVPDGTLVASLTDFRMRYDGDAATWSTNTSSPVEQPRDPATIPIWPADPYEFEYFDDFFRWFGPA